MPEPGVLWGRLKAGVLLPEPPVLVALDPKAEGPWGFGVDPNKDGVELPELGAPTFPKRPPPLEPVLELF